MTKVCAKCGVEKGELDFNKDPRRSGGLYSRCKSCVCSYGKERYRENLASIKQKHATYRKNNPEKLLEVSLKCNYGMPLEQWDELMLNQGGVCAICQKEGEEGKRLCVDHEHGSHPLKIRGLLCQKCNQAVGLLQDSSENCFEAGKYLNRANLTPC